MIFYNLGDLNDRGSTDGVSAQAIIECLYGWLGFEVPTGLLQAETCSQAACADCRCDEIRWRFRTSPAGAPKLLRALVSI